MTIISHQHRFIFLKTRKTAGTSIESWLCGRLGPRDVMATSAELDPIDRPFMTTFNLTTGRARLERKVKKRLRRLGWPAFQLTEHMPAAEVRAVAGDRVWASYRKICVERAPWDRVISLWRFMQFRYDRTDSLDDYLTSIEEGREPNWSDWPIYTIGGRLIADDVIRYDELSTGLERVLGEIGLPLDSPLPRRKAGIRGAEDTVGGLTEEQTARISRLYHREIALFGFAAPQPAE